MSTSDEAANRLISEQQRQLVRLASVLLVPTEGDPLGLLAGGLRWPGPPVAWRYWPIQIERGLFRSQIPWTPGPIPRGVTRQAALVLVWGGKAVPEGVFRLWYHLDDWHVSDSMDAGSEILLAVSDDPADLVKRVQRWVARSECGTLVLLDADGREVTP